jgi:cytidyltransferase-like protein
MGTFDLLHWGHIEFLKQCQTLAPELVVGVNSDEFVETFKPKPVMSTKERIHYLTQLGYVAAWNKSSGKEFLEYWKPQILATGTDWARKDYLKQIGCTQDWLDEQGIILAYIPYVQTMPISSTEIKRRIREQC